MKKGKVTLIGAGPGDPELITVKGLNAIRAADVILYDALIDERLLDERKDGAHAIYVGKRCGRHSLRQEDINTLINQMCLQYDHVVRLKGGDPYVFGRGHEEQTYLTDKGISVDVIPGVSSVTSLSSLQSVPLTKRNYAQSFWVLTGTTKDHLLPKDLVLAAQSDATVVILMGLKKIDEICQIYKVAGRRHLPVMIISKGATSDEKVLLGTVDTIARQCKKQQVPGPAVIIIGSVVTLHQDFVLQKANSQWI